LGLWPSACSFKADFPEMDVEKAREMVDRRVIRVVQRV
jgi:hypothetical protein